MKVPVPISDKIAPEKSQPITIPPPEPGPRRSEERDYPPRRTETRAYQPRYVALPPRHEHGQGRRNLIGGVFLLVLAVLLMGWAIYLAGAAALLTLAACLATATLLYIMARSRLFRQRNGGFVAWAGVALLGVMLVILHHGWLFLAGKTPAPAPVAAAPLAAMASPAPVETALPPTKLPSLHSAFPPPTEAPNMALRITRDVPVVVAGKTYLAKAGELYPFIDIGINEYRFAVAGHEVTVSTLAAELAPGEAPAEAPLKGGRTPPDTARGGVDYVPPKNLPIAEQTLASHKEAMRRYPELGQVNSEKNRTFATACKELNFSGNADFFNSPNWPLELAEQIAQKDGWVRADAPEVPAEAPPREGSRSPR